MYKAMYLHLFNACTDALRALEVVLYRLNAFYAFRKIA